MKNILEFAKNNKIVVSIVAVVVIIAIIGIGVAASAGADKKENDTKKTEAEQTSEKNTTLEEDTTKPVNEEEESETSDEKETDAEEETTVETESTTVAGETETETTTTAGDNGNGGSTAETPTEAPSVQTQSPAYTYTELNQTMYAKSGVNVRSGPAADFDKMGALVKNEQVHVVAQCNETKWYKIDFEGGYAFVSNNYLVTEKIVESTGNSGSTGNTGTTGGNNGGGSTGSTSGGNTGGTPAVDSGNTTGQYGNFEYINNLWMDLPECKTWVPGKMYTYNEKSDGRQCWVVLVEQGTNDTKEAERIWRENGFYQLYQWYGESDPEYPDLKRRYDLGCLGIDYDPLNGVGYVGVWQDLIFPGHRYYTGYDGAYFGKYQGKKIQYYVFSEYDLVENKSDYVAPTPEDFALVIP